MKIVCLGGCVAKLYRRKTKLFLFFCTIVLSDQFDAEIQSTDQPRWIWTQGRHHKACFLLLRSPKLLPTKRSLNRWKNTLGNHAGSCWARPRKLSQLSICKSLGGAIPHHELFRSIGPKQSKMAIGSHAKGDQLISEVARQPSPRHKSKQLPTKLWS